LVSKFHSSSRLLLLEGPFLIEYDKEVEPALPGINSLGVTFTSLHQPLITNVKILINGCEGEIGEEVSSQILFYFFGNLAGTNP